MSKGGSETQTTELPDWLKQPAIRNLQRAEDVQRIPYMPYRGADVAAFTPATNASFNTNIGAAEAFGLIAPGSLTATSGMPEPTEFAGGWSGYSSMPLYDQALAETKANQPEAWEQYQALYGANVPTQRDAPPSNGGGGGGGIIPTSPTVHTTTLGDTLNLGGGDVTTAEALDQLNADRSKIIEKNPDGSFVNVLGTGDKEAQDNWNRIVTQTAIMDEMSANQGTVGEQEARDAYVANQISNQYGEGDMSGLGTYTQGGYSPASDVQTYLYDQELKKKMI